MTNLKRLLSAGLAIAMLGVSVAGCGNTAGENPAESVPAKEAESAAAVSEDAGTEADTASAEADAGENPWWVGDEPITVTGMGSLGTLYINKNDYNDIMAIPMFSEKTNLHIDWTTMTNPENESEQINLSFASKKMPDIYTHIGKVDAVKYGEQGALIDLWPLVTNMRPTSKTRWKRILRFSLPL